MDQLGKITLYNADCQEIMKIFPDKYFDLAIIDPPYGINVTKMSLGCGGGLLKQDGTVKKLRDSRLKGSGKLKNRIINQMSCDWDFNPPTEEYFFELFRISKNQIIWGGNYFNLPPTRCVVCWDKEQVFENFSQIELAWTSYDKPAKLFRYSNAGFRSKDKSHKIHPTQKPVELYKYLLKRFANPEMKIIDTHLGSGSICLACDDLGCEMTGIEIDTEYYEAAKKRIINHQKQLKIFV